MQSVLSDYVKEKAGFQHGETVTIVPNYQYIIYLYFELIYLLLIWNPYSLQYWIHLISLLHKYVHFIMIKTLKLNVITLKGES